MLLRRRQTPRSHQRLANIPPHPERPSRSRNPPTPPLQRRPRQTDHDPRFRPRRVQSNRQTIRLEYQREIFPGYDADLCIWYPDSESSGDAGEEKAGMKPFELDNGMLHHDIDYTPYEGMTFKNWPRYTI